MSDSIMSAAPPGQNGGGSPPPGQNDGGSPPSATGPRGDPPIRLFPPRPGGWIKAFSIGFGLASAAVWALQSAGHSAAAEMPTALAASLAAMLALYHIGYVVAPFLVGRGAWPSFLGLLTLAPAIHGWVLVYGRSLTIMPTQVAAIATGCLAALVVLAVIGLRDIIAAMRRPGSRPAD